MLQFAYTHAQSCTPAASISPASKVMRCPTAVTSASIQLKWSLRSRRFEDPRDRPSREVRMYCTLGDPWLAGIAPVHVSANTAPGLMLDMLSPSSASHWTNQYLRLNFSKVHPTCYEAKPCALVEGPRNPCVLPRPFHPVHSAHVAGIVMDHCGLLHHPKSKIAVQFNTSQSRMPTGANN